MILTCGTAVDLLYIDCQIPCGVENRGSFSIVDAIQEDKACVSTQHVIVRILELRCLLVVHLFHGEHRAQLDAHKREERQDNHDGG